MTNPRSNETDWASLSNEEAYDLAKLQIAEVTVQLKAAKKALLRDWEMLTPERRSASSRQIKQLEKQMKALDDVLKMTGLA